MDGLQLWVVCQRPVRRSRQLATKSGSHVTYIILSEQMERAEHLVVLDVKRPCGLEVTLECDEIRGLDVELLGGADLAKVLVVLLGGEARCPPRPAAVVVVRVGVHVLLLLVMVLLRTVVEELRHDGSSVVDDGGVMTTRAKQRG